MAKYPTWLSMSMDSFKIQSSVVYFDQLWGATCTWELVEILVWAIFKGSSNTGFTAATPIYTRIYGPHFQPYIMYIIGMALFGIEYRVNKRAALWRMFSVQLEMLGIAWKGKKGVRYILLSSERMPWHDGWIPNSHIHSVILNRSSEYSSSI